MMEKLVSERDGRRNGVAVSDELSIQFVNTVACSLRDRSEEKLPSAEALLDWFQVVGLVTPGYFGLLRARWRKHPDEAGRLHGEAVALREALYQLFRARLAAQPISEPHVRLLNATLRASAAGLRVVHCPPPCRRPSPSVC